MKNNNQFELMIESDWFKKDEILQTRYQQEVKVISIPKKNNKWWQVLIRVITFNLFCKVKYTYTVETINNGFTKKESNSN